MMLFAFFILIFKLGTFGKNNDKMLKRQMGKKLKRAASCKYLLPFAMVRVITQKPPRKIISKLNLVHLHVLSL